MNKKYSRRGRKVVKQGAAGEEVARVVLEQLGLVRIQKIETGFKVVRWIDQKKNIGIVFPFRSVAGDFTAMDITGRSFLIEVKTKNDKNLTWTSFAEHQIESLNDHAQYGVSLVVFVFRLSPGYSILQWPIEGFKKGKGLTIERALKLSINSLNDIVY